MRVFFLGIAAFVFAGCGTKNNPDGGTDSGTCMPMEAGAGSYPAGPYGATPHMGSIAGDIIQNFSFQGYLNLDPTKKTMKGTLQTIKLSDFYDPTGTKFRLIHIITSAGWCGPCIAETQCLAMSGGTPETLAASKVVFIQAIMEGVAQGSPSTQADLDDWITKYSPNFTEVLDPAAANLGIFSPASAVPFSVTIDARTMEIVAKDKSFTSCPAIQTELQSHLGDAPIPTGCQ